MKSVKNDLAQVAAEQSQQIAELQAELSALKRSASEKEESERPKRIRRGYSPTEVQRMDIPCFDFDGPWLRAFGRPARTGTWIIWGASGNGKSYFVMQLAKYLCRWCKVAYDSLEESTGLSLQNRLRSEHMEEVNRRFLILDREPMDALSERLKRRRSPDVVIVDSFQYSGLSYDGYKHMKEEHGNKLLIFVSHSEGQNPSGRTAKRVMFDADVKIRVEGYRAVCKGRFVTEPGNHYTIWQEGAAQYYNRI